MSRCGWEALPDIQEWSGDTPVCLVVVGRPSQMSGRPSRMFCSGQEALPDVQVTPGCPEVVGRPSRMYGSGREALSDVREW